MAPVKVLAAVSEIYPLVKTGGLADVAGALPAALAPHGIEVASLVPGYPAVMNRLQAPQEVLAYDDLFGGPARVVRARADGLDLLAIEAPHLFARAGNPYLGPDGRDWPDNAFRFAALGHVAAHLGLGHAPAYRPDIVHGHDWQAGLAMAYLALADRPAPPTVMTIHNLAYQGLFPANLLGALRLPPHAFQVEGVEFYGSVGFLKAGLHYADRITTVSPTYAREIQGPTEGCGLDGLLRARAGRLSGILNGIDTAVWNPADDPHIPAHFDAGAPAGRAANKAALQRRFGLPVEPEALLFGVVSRLAWQKGLDVLADAVPQLLARGGRLALLGSGERDLEARFAWLAQAHRDRVACEIGYDETVAHLIQAGADAILIPSRFEPCGLTQLCAMRYGALPVAAKVGGLADTVIDPQEHPDGDAAATGIVFTPVTHDALAHALHRTATLWTDRPRWRRLQMNAMAADVSWERPAAAYARLYRDLMAAR
ncbi:MAG: glycogen synthase GlgA [Variibacter sp.]|nr:glycogen synthase GlgA [Variibacter sp.]